MPHQKSHFGSIQPAHPGPRVVFAHASPSPSISAPMTTHLTFSAGPPRSTAINHTPQPQPLVVHTAFVVSLKAFPLSSQYASVILHCELYCESVGEHFSVI